MDNNIFGIFLREKRLQQGLSLRELASKVGVGHTYIIGIEKGNKPPPSDAVLKALAKALKLNEETSELFYDLAMQSKRLRNSSNYYLPVDVSEYICKTDTAKSAIRKANNLGYTNEFWETILKKLSK